VALLAVIRVTGMAVKTRVALTRRPQQAFRYGAVLGAPQHSAELIVQHTIRTPSYPDFIVCLPVVVLSAFNAFVTLRTTDFRPRSRAFNRLIQRSIWQDDCLVYGVMARKFQMEIAAMAQTQSLSFLPRNAHFVPFVELRQSLPSTVAAIFPFTEQLMRFILNFRHADGSESDIEMALHEALTNAVVHGTGENACKRVYVSCRCYIDGEVSITVRDEGRGFDGKAVPDPTSSENLLFTHGRGIYLMKVLMDEVCFEEGGAVVMMRKKSNASSSHEKKAQWHDHFQEEKIPE
jgi:serine/threonine-protein kinase RsbW